MRKKNATDPLKGTSTSYLYIYTALRPELTWRGYQKLRNMIFAFEKKIFSLIWRGKNSTRDKIEHN